MGDAARAEARRRRILENSQKRLERITGREEKPIPGLGASTDIGKHQPEDSVDDATVFETFEGNVIEPSPLFSNLITENPIEDVLLSNEKTTKDQDNDRISQIVKSRVHIMIVAMFVYLIQLTTNSIVSYYFFLPLVILEITEYFLVDQIQSNSMLKTVLSLSGIPSHKLHWLFELLSFIHKTTQDACLYLFTYVVIGMLFHITLG